MNTFEEETFKKINSLEYWEYEDCTFIECNFSGQDFSNYNFENCEFQKCNLSMLKVIATTFSDIKFIDSKMQWIHFNDCNDFNIEFSFNNCDLSFSIFLKLNLKWINFDNCKLKEVNFIETNLIEATFEGCDLLWAIFSETNITKADFITSYNYSLDPELNIMKKAKFWLEWVWGLLLKYDIFIK